MYIVCESCDTKFSRYEDFLLHLLRIDHQKKSIDSASKNWNDEENEKTVIITQSPRQVHWKRDRIDPYKILWMFYDLGFIANFHVSFKANLILVQFDSK